MSETSVANAIEHLQEAVYQACNQRNLADLAEVFRAQARATLVLADRLEDLAHQES